MQIIPLSTSALLDTVKNIDDPFADKNRDALDKLAKGDFVESRLGLAEGFA
jgi:hypothetical protein